MKRFHLLNPLAGVTVALSALLLAPAALADACKITETDKGLYELDVKVYNSSTEPKLATVSARRCDTWDGDCGSVKGSSVIEPKSQKLITVEAEARSDWEEDISLTSCE